MPARVTILFAVFILSGCHTPNERTAGMWLFDKGRSPSDWVQIRSADELPRLIGRVVVARALPESHKGAEVVLPLHGELLFVQTTRYWYSQPESDLITVIGTLYRTPPVTSEMSMVGAYCNECYEILDTDTVLGRHPDEARLIDHDPARKLALDTMGASAKDYFISLGSRTRDGGWRFTGLDRADPIDASKNVRLIVHPDKRVDIIGPTTRGGR